MIPALIAIPFGPMLAWKRADLAGVAERLAAAALAALAATAVTLWLSGATGILAALAVGLAFWLIVGSFTEPVLRAARGGGGISVFLRRFFGLPRAAFGTTLGHFGMGLTVLGIAGASGYDHERITSVVPGERIEIAGYDLTFEGSTPRLGPNFREEVARFAVTRDGRAVAEMTPTKRFYPARQMPTTEAAILTRGFSQLYVSLGDPGADGRTVVRAQYQPMVTLIWLGCVVMALGGCLSLADRRLRVGAPRPARRAEAVAVA